ncbi:cytochrome P450 2J4-like [Paramacrobiotus metropolitanus]|uniref:cytochrome P450 2J4-like n=1 Tax=Paramacrobiotus metropolitanus TaxID=2943436 RepID=UPI002445DA7D|nr:cytochrome P450 2J4-like [Paramacrobiotus metropolitanus]
MLTTVSVLVGSAAFLAAVLYFLQRWSSSAPRRPPAGGVLPPQPPGWPLLGNLTLMLSRQRHRLIQAAGSQLGGCMTLKVGPRRSVWITSYEYFREAVINHAWEFAGRPAEMADPEISNELGIAASGVSEPEREIRKFTLISLRSFGFGKSSMQETMLREADELVSAFRRHCSTASEGRLSQPRPFNPRSPLANAAANVICSVLMGNNFQQGDTDFRVLSDDLTEAIKKVMLTQQARSFPLLRLFVNRGIKTANDTFRRTHAFLKSIVADHVEQHQPGMPRDFVDDWFDKAADEAAKAGDKPQGKPVFRAEHLPTVLMDLFIGGFETTTTTFQWIFLMLLHNPDAQTKIHEEMERVLGSRSSTSGQQVTLEQRDALVYTEAVILETLRKYPLIPFAIPHLCTQTTKLGDYTIPQGTQVMLHLFSIHHDPALFPEPERFLPERFLGADGRLSVPEQFVPFSAGRRSCIGEQLARKELFLFFANIMLNFSILPAAEGQLPSLNENDGIVMYPDPYEIILQER